MNIESSSESSSRIKEFRHFTGLSIDAICKVFNVKRDIWLMYESGEKTAPLTIWFKVVSYVIRQRTFFTSSGASSSDSADVVDNLDARAVEIRDKIKEIAEDGQATEADCKVILDNTQVILDNLPSLYR